MPEAPRLLVLGGGRHQLPLIRRAEQRGVRVAVADYYPDAPGKAVATFGSDTDALDANASIAFARELGVRGVITTGTDQPLVTMAEVARALGLPCYLTPDQARAATHKLVMAERFRAAGVRRSRFVPCHTLDDLQAARDLRLPLVVKPADSQGQRGTTRVDEASELPAALLSALAASRGRQALVEEFVPGYEITVSAWIERGRAHILAVTDRVTYNAPPALGVCFQHIFPSAHAESRLIEIQETTQRVVDAYGVTTGPLYAQMIVAADAIYVVEASCRVGGGHEASLIPLVTGVDVIDRLIDLALTGRAPPVAYHQPTAGPTLHALVTFLLASAGEVREARGFDEALAGAVVLEGGFYVGRGHKQLPITNSLGRVGYFLAAATTRAELLARSRAAYDGLRLEGEGGRNLLFWPDAATLNG